MPGFAPQLSATPGGQRRNAPTLGQDADAMLRDAGWTEEKISALRLRGTVA